MPAGRTRRGRRAEKPIDAPKLPASGVSSVAKSPKKPRRGTGGEHDPAVNTAAGAPSMGVSVDPAVNTAAGAPSNSGVSLPATDRRTPCHLRCKKIQAGHLTDRLPAANVSQSEYDTAVESRSCSDQNTACNQNTEFYSIRSLPPHHRSAHCMVAQFANCMTHL